MSEHQAPTEFQILAFDVFGTVVDWHGSIQKEVERRWPQLDGDAFARAWRAGYVPAMQRVRSGELGWTRIDELHRLILESLLPQFGLSGLSEAERQHLNRVWHRLDPWPDVVAGLKRLKTRFTICTLSNGNLALLTALSKWGQLPWDCLLSAELFHAYKPDPAAYLGVADIFKLRPQQTALVAAHHDDLDAARSCGMVTAYIERPLEFGAGHIKDVSAQARHDFHAKDLLDLASQLNC